ncbi:MAG: hypothetical protein B6U86_03835 [Candidatus Altiarchaeales archaeon ex4484_43]|nr:MAG: hypothetical protein B6U86_03835 [Candidatus Altiarchaeales archaeon ex4484_43]
MQIDIENTERFNITYIDEDGREKYPLLLHASISGSIDRNVYALLEHAYINQRKGKKPMLPLWLSPTQVRLLPLSDEFIPLSEKISNKLEKGKIRVDIDDRNETISKRIRDAEREWVPRIIVIGEREKATNKFNVRIRESDEQREMSLPALIKEIGEKTRSFPFKPLPLPKMLSRRPSFEKLDLAQVF